MPRKVSMGPEQESFPVDDDLFGSIQQGLQEDGIEPNDVMVGAIVRGMVDPGYRDRVTYAILNGDPQFPAGLLRAFQEFGAATPADAAVPAEQSPAPQAVSPTPNQGLPDLATLLGMQPQGPAPAGMPQGQPGRIPNQNPASLRALVGPYLNRGR